VLSLARGFLASGASRVLVSQWPVNDRSTAMLMERFYQQLLRGSTPASQALAEAKRSLLASSETRSPFFWAPFVLIGDPGPLRE